MRRRSKSLMGYLLIVSSLVIVGGNPAYSQQSPEIPTMTQQQEDQLVRDIERTVDGVLSESKSGQASRQASERATARRLSRETQQQRRDRMAREAVDDATREATRLLRGALGNNPFESLLAPPMTLPNSCERLIAHRRGEPVAVQDLQIVQSAMSVGEDRPQRVVSLPEAQRFCRTSVVASESYESRVVASDVQRVPQRIVVREMPEGAPLTERPVRMPRTVRSVGESQGDAPTRFQWGD